MLQMYGNSYLPTQFGYGLVPAPSMPVRSEPIHDSLSMAMGKLTIGEPKAEEAATLFLGDLSVYCTEKDIRKLFRPFGVIEAIRVKRGSSNKTNLSYGFIKFSTREAAAQALQQLNGVMFLGRSIKIGWAEGKSPNKVRVKPEKKVDTAQVHVSFISKQVDVLVSEATIRGLFGLYGLVVDVALKKSQFDKTLKVQNGYGFVHYPLTEEGIKSAITAVHSLHQVTIDRVTYDCSVSHALEPFVQHAQQFGMDSFSSNFANLLRSTSLPSQSESTRDSPPAPRIQPSNEDRMMDPLNLCRPSSSQAPAPLPIPQYVYSNPQQNYSRPYDPVMAPNSNPSSMEPPMRMHSALPNQQQMTPNPFSGVHYRSPPQPAMMPPHLQHDTIFSFAGMPAHQPFPGNHRF